jgi:hypothetical protein
MRRALLRVGRMTPKGKVTFFPVPTLESVDEVNAGPGGDIWFTAGDEIGKISTAGRVGWPGCFTDGCSVGPYAGQWAEAAPELDPDALETPLRRPRRRQAGGQARFLPHGAGEGRDREKLGGA